MVFSRHLVMRCAWLLALPVIASLLTAVATMPAANAAEGTAEHTVATSFEGGGLSHNATFDLEVKAPEGIAINSLDSVLYSSAAGGSITVSVYTRPGGMGHPGGSLDGWTPRGSHTTSVPSSTAARRTMPVGFYLPAGTWGVALVVEQYGATRRIQSATGGPSSYEDDALKITTRGIWPAEPFGQWYANGYHWNGAINYDDAPQTTIDSGPTGPTASREAAFTYSGVGPDGLGFECRLTPPAPGGTDAFTACPASGMSYAGLADGDYTFAVRAVDPQSSRDPSPATRNFSVDGTPPAVRINDGPHGRIPLDAPVSFTYAGSPAEDVARFECMLARPDVGAGWETCAVAGRSYDDLPAGDYAFSVRAFDAVGNFTVDQRPFEIVAPPETEILSGLEGPTNHNTSNVTYRGQSRDLIARFECAVTLNRATPAYAPCASTGTTIDAVAQGSYTVWVRAVDTLGQVDPTPAKRTFVFDTTTPTVTIDSGPQGPTAEDSASFTFSGTDQHTGVVGFDCRLGTSGWISCDDETITYQGLAEAEYTFAVRSRDGAGNHSTPATRTFTVDTTAPGTTIDGGPSGLIADHSPAFTYSGSPAGDVERFECALTRGTGTPAFTDCRTDGRSYSDLDDGDYTFSVRAVDAAGNTDPTPAMRSFTVDTTAPDTEITNGPEGPTDSGSPTFTYRGSPAADVDRFECAMTPAGSTVVYRACSDLSNDYTDLADGSYTFSVRAVDAAGNADSTPAIRSFTVDTTAPITTITGGSSGQVSGSSLRFDYRSDELAVDFECRLLATGAEGPFAACPAGSISYEEIEDGSYVFEVRATDAVGNVGPPARREVRVDNLLPAISASVHSARPVSATGWYRDPVTVRFTCDAGSSQLATSCPAPVRLTLNGSEQVVVGSIRTRRGDVAETRVQVNIDRARPKVRATRFRPGRTYTQLPRVRCRSWDWDSGVASCTVRTRISANGKRVVLRLRATDRAGNVRTKVLRARYAPQR